MRTYLRVIAYGRPYFSFGAFAIVSLFLYTLFSTATLLTSIPFLEILFDNSQKIAEANPAELSIADTDSIKDYAYFKLEQAKQHYGTWNMLIFICVGLLIINLLKNAFRYLASWNIAPLEFGILENIRNDLFDHLNTLSMSFYSKKRKGDLINTTLADVQVIQEAVISTVQQVIQQPFMILVVLATLFVISWKLTLFVLIILPITAYFINIITKQLKRKAHRGQEVLGELVSTLDEFVGGIRIVKAFQAEDFEKEKYQSRNRDYSKLQISIKRRVETASPTTEILSFAIIAVIILYAGNLILEGTEGSPKRSEFIGFLVLFTQLLNPIKIFSNSIAKVQKGIAAFERIESLLAEKAEIIDVPTAISVNKFKETLEFQDVYFKYEKDDVLKGISFKLEKGKTIALVGPSGGGKSTIADLIPRFFDPYQGKILLDGTDIRQIKLKSLRSFIGNVTQESILFHDSIASNIAYGIADASKEDIIQAAKIANAHRFIIDLPEQYDTIIGERGTRLSGGQRQRISIARAVLRNPEILILDEATSNLDTESEKLVQEALEKLMQERTTLVIAHRLSTILNADEILSIEGGRIVERGKHQELIQNSGMYRRLYDLQFGD
ncbi:MAG: ABC transporter ATP-binding protein [Bacteroidia bacterium]|nr:ABC transporter ATP-binding protein [Bacteroidia bacterium]